MGVRHVEGVVRDQLKWIFRAQPVRDYGIDAHAEIVSDDQIVTGRLIGLQIKGGDSYFSKPNGDEGWSFYDSNNHLSYWLGHSLPTVVVRVNSEHEAFWQVISTRTITEHGEGFTVRVPRSQPFDATAREALLELARHPDGLIEQFPRHLAVLPPGVGELLRTIETVDQLAAVRLAEYLAVGRGVPALAAASLIAARPSWLVNSATAQNLWRAVAAYARDHHCFAQAGEAFSLAADLDGPQTARSRAEAGLALIATDRDRARRYLESAREQGQILIADVGLSLLEIPEGDGRPAAIPASIRDATAEQLAAEPVTLLLLAGSADRRGELDAAVGFAERAAAAASARDTATRLELARLIHRRALMSDMSPRAFHRALGLAREVVEERRRWNGPSAEALALLLDVHIASDMAAALRAARPSSEGGTASDTESRHPEIAWRGAHAALALGNESAYQFFMDYIAEGPHRRQLLALEAEAAGRPVEERIAAHQAVLSDPADDALAARSVAALVKLGVWPPQADELRDRSVLPSETYDLLKAQYRARTDDKEIGIARLREMAVTSAHAALELVMLLDDLEGPDSAIAEARRQLVRWPASGLSLVLLDLYGKNGREEQAEQMIERGLGDESVPPDALLRLATWYVARRGSRREYAEAAAFATAALEIGDNPELAWNLVKVLFNSGDVVAARNALARHRPEPVREQEMLLWMQLHLGVPLAPQDAPTLIGIVRRLPDGRIRDAAIGVLVREVLLTAPQAGDRHSDEVIETTKEIQEQAQNRPGSTIRLDSVDDETLRAALENTQPDAAAYQRLAEQVRQGRASLADVARLAEQPYGTALLRRPGGIIPAADLSAALRRVGEAAASVALDTGTCVADLSSLHLLGLLDDDDRLRIRARIRTIIVARSAVLDATLTRDLMRALTIAAFTAALRPDGTVERTALTTLQQAALREQSEALEALAASLDVQSPTTRTDAAAALAKERGLPLWCDDTALRQTARHNGVATFSILDLITTLEDRESTVNRTSAFRRLANQYVVDLPLNAEDITALGTEHDWAPGLADTVLGRPEWWRNLGESWPDTWLHIAGEAATHSDSAFLRIVRAALFGALASINPGQATQRYQRMLVLALIACHERGRQPPADLLAELAQNVQPGVAPEPRYVLTNLIEELRARGADDAITTARQVLPGVNLS